MEMLMTARQVDRIMAERREKRCAVCGEVGIHVDTTAGEVTLAGLVVGTARPGETRLLADPQSGGELTCDECAEEAEG